MNMPSESRLTVAVPAVSRSAKTNGSRQFVAEGDGRGPWARRWRDLQALYRDDLGGASSLSEFQLGLIATASTLRCEIERLEGRLSLGETVDLDQFGRLAGHYRRICETLGIERKARTIGPTLSDLLREDQRL